ncbi:MAG TPA: VWA domain-containing protein [Luteimonas sp.]|nr:VWA domain-containing protein [Luteimonas sp.]
MIAALDMPWADFAGFAWQWALLALPLPWLVNRLLPPMHAPGPALRVPLGQRLVDAARSPGVADRRGNAAWLLWLAWILLCIAMARPQYWGEVVQPPQASRELMLAVDLSGSMGEEDMVLGGEVVDRLTAAKAVIADFLGRRDGDRVGLLVFGQRAYALSPLTLDRASVADQLADTVVGLAGRETAIGDAIGLAVKRLRDGTRSEGPAGGQPRVLVLLTDGVNTAGLLDPLKAAELARDAGVRVHTVAFGGENDGLSMFGFSLPGGASEIDEGTLERIATMTGGRSFRARDTESLAGIYAEIDRLEPVSRPGRSVRPRNEGYPWPLGAALGTLLLAAAGVGRRRA